jgi:hypothetical protein
VCDDPCRVLVTQVVKKKHSNDLRDRLREGKGCNRPDICGILNGDKLEPNLGKEIVVFICVDLHSICFPPFLSLKVPLLILI